MIAQKTAVGIKYIREKWQEYFVVKVSRLLYTKQEMGTMTPRFFLPVRYLHREGCYECWIIPLAPFVLFGWLVWGMVSKTWRDLIEVITMWNDSR